MTVLPNARRSRNRRSGDGQGRVSVPDLSSLVSSGGRGLYGTGLSTDDFARMDPAEALGTYRTGRAENSLERGDPDPNEATTQAIVRLLQSPDQKARDKGVKSLQENYDSVTPELAEKYGIAKIREDFKPQGDEPMWKRALVNPTMKVLEVIGRPQQAVVETIQAGLNDLGIDAEEDWGKDKHKERGGYKDAWRALWGQKRWDSTKGKYVENLEFSSALGLDAEGLEGPLKYVTGAANVAGAVSTDPTVFVGGSSARGASKGLQAGASVLAREGAEAATPRLAKALVREGAEDLTEDAALSALKRVGFRKGLTAEQQAAARQLIIDGTPETLTTKSILSRTPRTVEIAGDRGVGGGFRRMTGRELRTGAERTADNAIEAARRFDRGGLRIAGRSVNPEAVRSPLRGALRGETRALGTGAVEAAVTANATDKLATLASKAEKAEAKRLKALGRIEAAGVPEPIPAGGRFHGSSQEIGNLADNAYAGSGAGNLYGPGFYTTDDAGIATTYTRKGRGTAPGVYKIDWVAEEPPRLLNLDTTTPTPEMVADIRRTLDHGDLALDDIAKVEEAIASGAPISAVYDGLRHAFKNSEITKSEADEIFEGINYNMQQQGYDGFSHLGGVKTGGKPHNVEIYFPDMVAEGKVVASKVEKAPGLRALLDSKDYDGAKILIADSGLDDGVRAELSADLSRVIKRDKEITKSLTAQRELTAAVDGGAADIAAHDPGLIDALAPLRERTPGSLPVIGTFGEGRMSRWARTAFKPRSDLLRSESLPAGVADDVYKTSVAARSAESQGSRQIVRRLEKAVSAANPAPEEYAVLLSALDVGGDVAATGARLRAEGKTGLADLLDEMDAVRSESFDTLTEGGLATTKKLRERDDYMARFTTPEGQEAIKKAQARGGAAAAAVTPFATGSKAKAIGAQDGNLLARSVDPDLPLLEFEAKYGEPLREAGLLKPDQTLVELNPAVVIAKRGNQIVQARQQAQFIDDLGGLKGPLGNPLVARIRPDAVGDAAKEAAKTAKRQGLIAVDLGESGVAYAHPELVPEIESVFSLIKDDAAVTGFDKTLKAWNNVWKAYATTPLIGGPSFGVRNATGNVVNNFVAGVRNPAYYVEAASAQRKIAKAVKEFPDLSIPEAMVKSGVDPNTVAKIEGALERGVIDEGFFHVDLGADQVHKLTNSARKFGPDWTLKASDPARLPGVATGRKFNEIVEDNARLAHFLSKTDELGDLDAAGLSVKKFLFDYGDLTPFERRRLKNLNAFYTFMRKNTPLQFAEIARNPSRYNQLNYAEQALFDQGNADPGKTKIPKYLSDYGTLTGPGVGSALSGTDDPVVASIDTPLKAAIETVNPLVQLAALTPGVKALVPKDMREDDPLSALGRSEVGLFSGGPAEFVKFGAEEATGRSLFTGANLKDGDGERKANALLRLSNAFAPIISKTNRTYGDPLDLDSSTVDPARTRATRALLGLNIKSVTEEMSTKEQLQAKRRIDDTIDALTGGLSSSERWALITSLRDTQSKARSPKEKRALQDQIDAVVDVPELAELRAIGVVPKPERPKRPS